MQNSYTLNPLKLLNMLKLLKLLTPLKPLTLLKMLKLLKLLNCYTYILLNFYKHTRATYAILIIQHTS